MDRNVITATVLIAIIMFVWMWWLAPPPPEPSSETLPADSQAVVEEPAVPEEEPEPAPLEEEQRVPTVTDSTIAGVQEGDARIITVETDLYEAQFSSKGATLTSLTLKEYQQFDQVSPVQMVDTSNAGALSLVFTTPQSHVVDTRSFFFEPDFAGDTLRVEGEPVQLSFEARVGGGLIRQTYTFIPGEYEVGLRVDQENASSFSTPEGYELVWHGAVPFAEGDVAQEAPRSGAYARSGGEVEGITLASESYQEQSLRGAVSWIAVKNKYFTATVMPDGETRGAELIGEKSGSAEVGTLYENYTASLLMPPASEGTDQYRLYIGPMEFFRITDYDLGLYGMVDYGYDFFEWMTRPLAKFIFIPAFTFLGGFIHNYGLVIIIFGLTIKMLLFPLTKSSYKSMAQMRELQPKMQEIKEKYGDNPQKQQEAMMKLYKEAGANPLGGCLPMLLQWPIIIALYQYLQQSIEIRQQGFLWATDLSAPDVILHLPIDIPFYGNYVAGFTLLMGLSLIVQMRIQGTATSAGPQGKVMMYVMPAFLFVIFNRLPSGLSLYYLCYNVVSAVQQQFINKSLKDDDASQDGKGSAKDARKAKRSRGGKRKKKGGTVRT